MIKLKPESITVDGKTYPVFFEKKNIRTIRMRLDTKTGSIYIRAPYFMTKRSLLPYMEEVAPKLIRKWEAKKSKIPEGKTAIFGELLDGEIDIKEKRRLLLEYCSKAQKEYEKLMNVPPYNTKVREMTTRYAVNNHSTKTITYSTTLVSYSKEIIDAIIIHELSHYFEHNHQKGFYDIVYRYCPNYKELHTKLRKGDIK